MTRNTIRSVKLRKKRRRVFLVRISFFIIFVAIVVGALVYGFNTNVLKIQNVVVRGGQEFVNKDVEEYAEQILAGAYLGMLSKQNILFYPKRQIKSEILNNFPRLKDISLELDPFKEQILDLRIAEREEDGVWCRKLGEELDCYFIDSEGYVFAPAPTYSDGVVFSYHGYIEGDPVGSQYIEGDALKNISAFIQAIKNNQDLNELQPIGLEYLNTNEYKLLLKDGSFVLFSDIYGIAYAYDNLVISMTKEEINLSEIEYIDIRIPNKVFYKHKDSELTSE